MSPRTLMLWLAPALLIATGCGSSHSAPKPTNTANPTGPLVQSTASGAPSTPSTTATATATSTGGSSTTTSSPGTAGSRPSRPTGGAGLPRGTNSGRGTNARVPATFTIGSGGKLSPSGISAPAFLAVQLTVVSHDGKSHRVLLRTPRPHSLRVPANGHASVLVAGLRAGRYAVIIDGTSRGALTIGGEPGP